VAYDNNKNYDEKKTSESFYSKKIKAGKRRTYFFDVRETRSNDYFITITESKKRFNDDGYDRHKMFIYKEDFNKFLAALTDTINHVKTELMPDFDFDAFNHNEEENENGYVAYDNAPAPASIYQEPTKSNYAETTAEAFTNTNDDTVDTWNN